MSPFNSAFFLRHKKKNDSPKGNNGKQNSGEENPANITYSHRSPTQTDDDIPRLEGKLFSLSLLYLVFDCGEDDDPAPRLKSDSDSSPPSPRAALRLVLLHGQPGNKN